MLLVSWLLFAPLFLVLRRALLPRAGSWPEAGALRDPDDVAKALFVSHQLIDGAFGHAERAQLMGHRAGARSMVHCLRQGTNALLRDLRRDLTSWRHAADEVASASGIRPLRDDELRSCDLRALAWADRAGRAAVVGAASRIRLRLVILRAMATLLLWRMQRLRPSASVRSWRDLEAARADLAVLLDEACRGRRALAGDSGGRPTEHQRCA